MREKRKMTFLKEIAEMMYGCGDVNTPRHDTAEVIQEYLVGYIKSILIKTHNMAKIKGKTKTDDLMYFLKKDRKKYGRVKELLATNEELKNARNTFDLEKLEKE